MSARRDLLVQQLLQERRRRLEQKLSLPEEAPLSPPKAAPVSKPLPTPLPASPDDGFLASVLSRLQAAEQAEAPKPRARSLPPKSPQKKSHKSPKTSQPSPRRPSKPPNDKAFKQRLQKWELQQKASKEKQMQAKQEKELQEFSKCTFQPSINLRSEFYAKRSRGCLAEALPERLYHEADKRANLRNKAKELMEADLLCSYTFQPEINENSRGAVGDRAPLHLRLETVNKKREERARCAQEAEEKRSEHFFQPKISSRSERLVQKKREKLHRSASLGAVECLKQLGPVEERLYAEGVLKDQRLAELRAAQEEELKEPSLDETSRQICKASVYFQGRQQDFLTRQRTFELAKQKRMDLRAQIQDTECSFQPRITETSRQLVCNNLELLGETEQERIERLAVRDRERREAVRLQLEELYHKDCTFKPELNAVSLALARERSTPCRSRREDSVSTECSFRPQLDPRSLRRFAHVRSRYAKSPKLMESIRQDQERRAEYLLERRRELEEERNADCTFTPSVSEGFQDSKRPVVVSGLDRFFELKNLALKQRQEQLEREQKVFRPETLSLGVTVCEPFQLSEA